MVVILVATFWDRFYEDTGLTGVILAVVAVMLPLGLAAWLTSTCTAWTISTGTRCQNRRLGWRRCEESTHGRIEQPITTPEAAALLSIVVSITNAVLLLGLRP